MEDARRVAVAGATGHLGSHVARALKARGHFIRRLVRDRTRLGPGERSGVERFIYVSAFEAPEHRSGLEFFEAKEQVTDRLHASSLRETIVRPQRGTPTSSTFLH